MRRMLLLVMLLFFPILVQAQEPEATMQTVISGGDPTTIGEEFDLLVQVRDNVSGKRPIGCAFRIHYTTGSVELLSVSKNDLGDVLLSKQEEYDEHGPFRDVLTISDFDNMDLNPDCATFHFRVLSDAYPSYSIWLELDPFPNDPLIAFDSAIGLSAILVDFDNSATMDIAVPVGPNIADFNNDKVVNALDNLMLFGGYIDFQPQFDLSDDGRLDYKDIFLFSKYWGTVYP